MPLPITLSGDMGTFRVDVEVENASRADDRRTVRSVLIDTGAELSWFPADVLESLGIARWKTWRFRQADGTVLTRWTGAAVIRVGVMATVDEIVFAEPGDLVLLGSRSLEGLNLRVDPVRKELVDAGPAPAATSAPPRLHPNHHEPPHRSRDVGPHRPVGVAGIVHPHHRPPGPAEHD